MHRDLLDPADLHTDGLPAHADPDVGGGPVPGSAEEWERPPQRVPVLRWRAAVTSVLVVLVAAAAWWAVSWLTSPAPPAALPAAGVAAPVDPASSPEPVRAAAGPAAGERTPDEAGHSEPTGGPGERAARIRVHVVGEVRRPGVVELESGARVADAVRAAGGETRRARGERINLAAPLADGDQVLVPSATTPAESLSAPAAAGGTAASGAAGKPGVRAGAEAGARSGGAGGTVDLNTADAAELETLPGVGPATAEKIIAHRENVGPFTGLQDLDAVPGIGPAALERLRGRVSW